MIKYVAFSEINPEDFIPVLNEAAIRDHLVAHDLFDADSIGAWVEDKIANDAIAKCRIRGIYCDNTLVGWCGIQKDDAHYEIAIVIAQSVWGIGGRVFDAMMGWAREFGHEQVVIHLLETRPVYQFLKRRAIKTQATTMLGRCFVTYYIAV